MADWLKGDPIVISRGNGAVLCDEYGKKYLDANSSIWTNLHGHNHPALNRALSRQLTRIAHSSYLGLANQPASELAWKLVEMANPEHTPLKGPPLEKVFYSDDGSTAMEASLKLAYEFGRRKYGRAKPRFLSMTDAYHGDTIGASSLGHIPLFQKTYRGLMFQTDAVMSPYCYRCPYNRARPERADAREYRKCKWECVNEVEQTFEKQSRKKNPYTGFVVEPRIQGAAGMIPQPDGWLSKVATLARQHQSLLIADEVMTGFGRACNAGSGNLLASHDEGVRPDLLALAKGMTGGYLPMAATLTSKTVFDAFLGKYEEFKTFFHGHSYTGNQLGSAASLANLKILQSAKSKRSRIQLQKALAQTTAPLWKLPNVGDIRQVGSIVGIELVKDWKTRTAFQLKQRAGIRVCEALADLGVLTRPIGNVLVLMPPYCTTLAQVEDIVSKMARAIQTTLR